MINFSDPQSLNTTLIDNPANNFGSSVSSSSSGAVVVAGAEGGFYVYRRTSLSSVYPVTYSLLGQISDSLAATEPVKVAISPDGSKIAATFTLNNQNRVSVYSVNSNSLTLYAEFLGESGELGYGHSLAFSNNGSVLVVGRPDFNRNALTSESPTDYAGRVTIYKNGIHYQDIQPAQSQEEEFFGYDVSISSDGKRLAIGAAGSNNNSTIRSGAVYVYADSQSASNSYVFAQKITADNATAGSCFGSSVSISGNGSRLAVGAFGLDDNGFIHENFIENAALVVYDLLTDETCALQNRFLLRNGFYAYSTTDVKMSFDGNSFIISYLEMAPSYLSDMDLSIVRVFDYNGTSWSSSSPIQSSFSGYTKTWGSSIAYSHEGNNFFVGEPSYQDAGRVKIGFVSGLSDLVAPSLTSSNIDITSISYESVSLRWSAASDNVTAQSSITYRLYYADSSEKLASVESTWTQGVLESAHTGNGLIFEREVSSLNLDTTYYFTVIAVDSANNKTQYAVVQAKTLADTQAPTVTGPITYTSSKTSITLNWPSAIDNFLTVKVVYS